VAGTTFPGANRAFKKAAMAMDLFASAQDKAAVKAQHEVMKKVIKTARKFAPVDTGALRRSGKIRKLKSGSKVTFGGASTPKNVDYAHMVEYGTMYYSGRYFLRKALKAHQKELPKAVAKGITKQWNIYAKVGSTYR
jgi:HK97 gp10 family phage protein